MKSAPQNNIVFGCDFIVTENMHKVKIKDTKSR